MRSLLLVGLFLLGTAHADDAKRIAAIKSTLKQQVDQWADGGDDALVAFKKTVTSDARISRNGDWLRPDLMLSPPYNTKDVKITAQQIGWSGTFGWAVAEVTMTQKMYAEPAGAGDPHPKRESWSIHWIEVFVGDGDGVKGKAVGVFHNVDDKTLTSDPNSEVDRTPPIALAPLAHLAAIGPMIASDAATSVMGTGLGETAFGPDKSKKMLASWAKVPLEIIGAPKGDSNPQFYKPIEITAGDATVVWGVVRMKLGGEWRNMSVFAIARKKVTGFEYVAIDYAGY